VSAARPTLADDLYTDAAILDPFPLYRAIRDRAAAVWLDAHGVWALGRFADVRDALRADGVLVSGRGVALNDPVNQLAGETTLASDGDAHRLRRGLVMKPMMPSALKAVRPEIERLADALVADLAGRDAFDGIADFARHLPVEVVSRLVGLPDDGRERMLAWAAATFDVLGPMNARAQAAAPTAIREMAKYAAQLTRDRLRPDGWAARLFEAADAGAIEPAAVTGLLIDYIAPSLDTTILATGHLLHLLGRHPEAYDWVRADPARIPATVNEALRLGTPVRAFTRFAESDYEAGEVRIPAGDRVLVLFASANRDERRWTDPDRFDPTRDARDHVALGHGVHRCAGGHLAQLELEALLRALVARVRRIEVGEPRPLLSNVLHGHAGFAASFR
jgi:cytochrome P450